MDNHELSNSKGSASSFLSKIGKSSLSAGGPPPLPGGNAVEPEKRLQIAFRCAKSGERFSVWFKDNGSDKNYTIQNIVKVWQNSVAKDTLPKSDILWTPYNSITEPDKPELPSISADRIDWHGWYCPHCLWGRGSVPHLFIKCGKCSQFVCGARVEALPDGRERFYCYAECGRTGILSSEYISDFNAEDRKDPTLGLPGGAETKRLGGGLQNYLNG